MPKSIRNYFNLQFVWNFNIIVVIFILKIYTKSQEVFIKKEFSIYYLMVFLETRYHFMTIRKTFQIFHT